MKLVVHAVVLRGNGAQDRNSNMLQSTEQVASEIGGGIENRDFENQSGHLCDKQ